MNPKCFTTLCQRQETNVPQRLTKIRLNEGWSTEVDKQPER